MRDGWGARAGEGSTSIEHFSLPGLAHQMTPSSASPKSDARFYALAVLAGIATGWADVTINDLLFTALLVLTACMLLGIVSPRRPWRWVLLTACLIPLTEFAASWIPGIKPTQAQIYGSFLAAFPGIAGAYGGSFLRGVVENLRQGK